MCLCNVTWISKNPTKNPKVPTKWTKGYKVFVTFETDWDSEQGKYVDKPVLCFPYNTPLSLKTKEDLELNKVYKAEKPYSKDEIQASDYKQYPWGFHIFPAKMAGFRFGRDSKDNRFRLFLVEYRRVVAEGTHNIHTSYDADCVIAREMRIIRQLTEQEVMDLAADYEKVNSMK